MRPNRVHLSSESSIKAMKKHCLVQNGLETDLCYQIKCASHLLLLRY